MRNRREWRRRGERGQVAAVATILGLLLVVTFIANYLQTTLPLQMEGNEFSHVAQVENQVSRLQAVALATSNSGRTNWPVSQPVTLGSQAVPPFGPADSGWLTQGVLNSTATLRYSAGATVYSPPSFGANGGIPGTCTLNGPMTQITCGFYPACLVYNFTGGAGIAFIASAGSGSTCMKTSFTTNSSTVSVTEGGGGNSNQITIVGNSNTITLNPGGGSAITNLTVLGNSNTISLTCTSGSNIVNILVAGSNNAVLETCGGTTPGLVQIFGQSNFYNLTVNQGGSHFHAIFAGYNAGTSTCPYLNQSSTDKVGSFGGWNANGNTLNATFLNSVGYAKNNVNKGWTNYSASTPIACPFWTVSSIVSSPWASSGIVVHLKNSYVPSSEIAYDEGAVIYAQSGGLPVMLDGPAITLGQTFGGAPEVSIWLPTFLGNATTETGITTAGVILKLLDVNTITLPTSQSKTTLQGAVTLTIKTVYPSAWMNYFDTNVGLFPSGASCTGPGCSTVYNPGLTVATVTATLVTTSALTVQLALFSVTFT
jgi:hypothetical protein